ncbi:MAG: hypothetical protein Q7S02_05175 [bacterium]|nr:hypothetical protein [bacterium]
MKLSIQTNIPLEVLDADPIVFLGLKVPGQIHVHARLGNVLRDRVGKMWELLTLRSVEVSKWKNVGKKTVQYLEHLLEERGLQLDQFPELDVALTNATNEDSTFEAIKALQDGSWSNFSRVRPAPEDARGRAVRRPEGARVAHGRTDRVPTQAGQHDQDQCGRRRVARDHGLPPSP